MAQTANWKIKTVPFCSSPISYTMVSGPKVTVKSPSPFICPQQQNTKPSPVRRQNLYNQPYLSLSKSVSMASRLKELLKKYGKVALGVHFSVSAASITGLYIAIKNNVDVESLFDKYHLPGFSEDADRAQDPSPQSPNPDVVLIEETGGSPDAGNSTAVVVEQKRKNRTAELAASTGGALALAVLVNKALFPVRVPITIALTPPVARFLARARIINNSV